LALSSQSFHQAQNFDINSKRTAIFLYNFTRYFEWPKSMKTGNFIIHVVGTQNQNLIQELNKMASTVEIDGRKLEIVNSNNLVEPNPVHIIYILKESSPLIKEISKKYIGKGSLLITEKMGATKLGSAINFVVVNNKQQFEFNKNNATKAGLKASSELTGLAVVVN